MPIIIYFVKLVNTIKILLSGFIICLFFSSCFKDVDFGQAGDISLEPDLQVDLLYYNLDETDFSDSDSGSYTPVIRDTVRLEFLDDDYIQDGLIYTELRFRHENTFPHPIRSRISFLNKNNRNQFTVSYIIPEGSEGMPTVFDTIRILEGSEIVKMRRSFKMVVENEVVDGNNKLNGQLKFMSKGFFRFEF